MSVLNWDFSSSERKDENFASLAKPKLETPKKEFLIKDLLLRYIDFGVIFKSDIVTSIIEDT